MTVVPGTTRAQTIFLRSFRQSPTGPAPADWPAPAILRRWLRRAAFTTALNSIRDTFRFQVDFHLATAAAQAARQLTTDSTLSAQELKRLAELLRLAHLRQRFPAETSVACPATFEQRNEIDRLEGEIQEIRQERQAGDLDDDTELENQHLGRINELKGH